MTGAPGIPAQPGAPDAESETAFAAGEVCWSCDGENPAGMRFCGHCGRPLEGSPSHERRLVTALFADISGFTTLADTLDAEQLDGIISPVIRVLAGTAETYGGTLAKYAGDAVLVFFGAPVAQEDHAHRALLCALDMHAALAAELPSLPAAAGGLELHIGVNTGRVVTGMFGGDTGSDYSILGDSVNVAQRLESVAPPGQTFVGATTRELTEAEFVLTPLGELTLKGKAAPVPAWRLEGRRGAVAPSPGVGTARLLGRDAELATVLEVLGGARERGGVLAIVAEPGGGKSRLVEEARRQVEQGDVAWLEAHALSYGASLPYWPFVDLLRRLAGIRIDQDPHDAARRLTESTHLARTPAALPYFLRLLALPTKDDGQVDALSPESFQRGLLEAFVRWFGAMTDERPVVLVLGDVHWMDSASQELLRRLVRASRTTRLALCLTSRPEAAAALDELTDLADGVVVTRLTLQPLDRASVDALVEALFEGPVDPAVCEAVAARSSGNPFFAEQLVRALRGGGAVCRDGVWSLSRSWDDASAPVTIVGVLAARIDQLPRPTASLLQVAAVIGRRPDPSLLAVVSGVGPRLPVLLEQLVAAGFLDRILVEGKEQLSFHHALVVDVAYARLLRAQRVELHRRVAEAAEVLYGTADDVVDLLARHLYQAEAGVKAVDYLQRAAARAQRLFANEQATTHLRRALELTRATERLTSRLPTLLLDVADIEELTGDYAAAAAHYEEARTLTNDVRAWRGGAVVLRKRGLRDEALELIDRGLAGDVLAGQDVAPLWSQRAALLAYEGRTDEAVSGARAGLAVVADPQGPVAAELLLRIARALEATGACAEALSYAEQARDIFEARNDPLGLAVAYQAVGGLQVQLDALDEAVETLRRGLALAEQTGSAEDIGGCLINLGFAELRRGRPEEGAVCDARAIALFEEAGNRVGEATGHGNLAEKLLLVGEPERAWTHGMRALVMAEGLNARWTIADVHRTLALVAVARGEPDLARRHAQGAHDVLADLGDERQAEEVLWTVDAALERDPLTARLGAPGGL